jgi:hypothetical protein
MREIGKALGDDPARYDTLEASIIRLRTLLQNKAMLLVLDDIWNASDVETFRVDAPYCRMPLQLAMAGSRSSWVRRQLSSVCSSRNRQTCYSANGRSVTTPYWLN